MLDEAARRWVPWLLYPICKLTPVICAGAPMLPMSRCKLALPRLTRMRNVLHYVPAFPPYQILEGVHASTAIV